MDQDMRAARPVDSALIDTALAERRWPEALEQLFAAAIESVRTEANRAGAFIEDIDARCRALADGLKAHVPTSGTRIGFDRVTNVYVVTEIYQTGGHRSLIDQIIAARPHERHVVLFSGALESTRDFGIQTVASAGAFPIYPDRSLGLFDRLLWLREKLAAYAARRLFILHHPEDVIAATALAEFAPAYGPRAYVVHHADTVASVGTDLAGATHLAIRPEQKARLLAALPGRPVHVLPLTYDPSRLEPPIDPEVTKRLKQDEIEFLESGQLVTATCGGSHKFREKGPLALPEVIAAVLNETRGRHVHVGPVSGPLRTAIQAALTTARIPHDRVEFVGEVRSVAEALVWRKVDLFLNSFPVGGGLTIVEAAYAGLPIAVYGGAEDEAGRYVSGQTHVPSEVLVWKTTDDLQDSLRSFWLEDGAERLAAMSDASRRWYATRSSAQKFRRRLLAAIAVTEERSERLPLDGLLREAAVADLFDPEFYLRTYPDIAAAKVNPRDHYLGYGEREGRLPNALFLPSYYLAQLPAAERDRARKAPLTHYALRGEARGWRPHPFFDPEFCRASLAAAGRPMEEGEGTVLARYLSAQDRVSPHTFFDPQFYARQARLVPEGMPLLVHFLEVGAAEGLRPHPLLLPELVSKRPEDRAADILSYLSQKKPRRDEPKACHLFDPDGFCDGKWDHFAGAAPNLLWAHLVEGNMTGRDPHPLVSVRHVARLRPGTLVSADVIVRSLATNRLGVDTHPLVDGRHILKQAPFAATLPISPTQYFLESGVAHNVDPHPLFSVQFYLYNNPDVAGTTVNPLLHYLQRGQYEGRLPHPAFDGNVYYQNYLKNHGGGSPLLDYLGRGMALFRPSLAMDERLRLLTRETAVGLFQIGQERAPDRMLLSALHPDQAATHPTLTTEIRPLATTAVDAVETVEIHPEVTVAVDRPSVVAQMHIAPPSGSYLAPAATASIHHDAIVVPGNDGFLSESGTWIDHGLFAFDPRTMRVKENGAVVAVSDGHVLLRRYRSEMALPAGIFASGTYSHNYFHFLLEVLPRILLAAELAPEGTPILADAGMPDQHYQAIRLALPGYPVLQLSRHVSVKVKRLYAGSMPNYIQDAFEVQMPPVDAVSFHPALTRRLAAVFGADRQPRGSRRLHLVRDSAIRRVLNADAVREALEDRDFDTLRCGAMSLSEQIRLFSDAGTIVAQSGAHLTNMLFTPPGARVFPLFSNAPGTNYYLWSVLGAVLGHEVINIAGWRIAGTCAGRAPEAHEDFTLPTVLLAPFFPKAVDRRAPAKRDAEARFLLDELYGANAEADSLTGSWSVRAKATPPDFDTRLLAQRRRLRDLLHRLTNDQLTDLLDHPFFADFGRNIRSGYVTLRDLDADEQATVEAVEAFFAGLGSDSEDGTEAGQPQRRIEERMDAFPRMLALAILYLPAWRLPLVGDLAWVGKRLRKRYLAWLGTPPFLFRKGEDAGYVAFTARLLDWLAHHLDAGQPNDIRLLVSETAARLDLGQLLLVGEPVRPVLEARNRLLDQIAVKDDHPVRRLPRPADLSQGRIRVGILCRTFDKGPDSEAVVAFFRAFDHARYEIFAYSVGFQDRVVSSDEDFDREFDAAIDHRRVLPGDPYDMRERLLADDLDVFLYANATTFGLREQELALFHRVAPLQMVLNSHLPVTPGFPSFDAFLTGLSDDPAAEVPQDDYPERLVRVRSPVINYLNSLKPRPRPAFDRNTLGLAEDDVVMMNGGSLQKLRHECLVTMLRALAAVPRGKLLLAPYNPGWVARSQAFAFNHQLAEAAAEVGVGQDRIVVMGELSVAEAEAAVALSDIYLSSFPHGGATMTHLALIYGTPPVVLRRRDARSIDQFLVGSLGFDELLASTTDDYVALVGRLGSDHKHRKALSERVRAAARHPVFVANPDFSRAMQGAIDWALVEQAACIAAGRSLRDPAPETEAAPGG